jgi:predicted metal-dependent HD superfamily phosphohydrolase
MTAHHKAPARDYDAQYFMDMDMAVLGAQPSSYKRYAAAIEAEYANVVAGEAFYRGRLQLFVLPTLRRDRVFHTEDFEMRYGAAAMQNLEREKKSLLAKLPKP